MNKYPNPFQWIKISVESAYDQKIQQVVIVWSFFKGARAGGANPGSFWFSFIFSSLWSSALDHSATAPPLILFWVFVIIEQRTAQERHYSYHLT